MLTGADWPGGIAPRPELRETSIGSVEREQKDGQACIEYRVEQMSRAHRDPPCGLPAASLRALARSVMWFSAGYGIRAVLCLGVSWLRAFTIPPA